MVSFDVTPEERETIFKIVDRALNVMAANGPITKPSRSERRINLSMDLTACHANGNPLRLDDLLAADNFNLMHDVGGISRHIDHETGKLTDCFSPRFSRRESLAA